MRIAALCVAACFVTNPSATSHASEVTFGLSSQPDNVAEASPDPKDAAPSRAELCETAVLVAQANNLPAAFFTRLIEQESGFKPHVVSSAGAQGIAQFMPRTAFSRGLADPFKPIGALAASGKYLAELATQFSNLGLAAAAYNAGPKRVQDWIAKRSKLPAETRNYVYSITGRAAEDWMATRVSEEQIALQSPAGCSTITRTEADIPRTQTPIAPLQNAAPHELGVSHAMLLAGTRFPRGGGSERRSLPRPSQFVVGRPVSAAIKAAEARVLAKLKWSAETTQGRRSIIRAASIR